VLTTLFIRPSASFIKSQTRVVKFLLPYPMIDLSLKVKREEKKNKSQIIKR